MHTISFDHCDKEKGIRLECTITASIAPYQPGGYFDPPEGGYLEDEAIEVESFYLTIGSTEFDFSDRLDQDPALKAELVKLVTEHYDGDNDLQNTLYERMEEYIRDDFYGV